MAAISFNYIVIPIKSIRSGARVYLSYIVCTTKTAKTNLLNGLTLPLYGLNIRVFVCFSFYYLRARTRKFDCIYLHIDHDGNLKFMRIDSKLYRATLKRCKHSIITPHNHTFITIILLLFFFYSRSTETFLPPSIPGGKVASNAHQANMSTKEID